MIRFCVARTRGGAAALLALLIGTPAFGQSEEAANPANVTVLVVPFAQVQIVGTPLLYLEVPPAHSTIPSNGVNFTVTGNASATIAAEPNDFVLIHTSDYPDGEYMGKAVLNGNPVGYKLRLDFPTNGMIGSPTASANLPAYQAGPTYPPLGVNLQLTGGARNGRLHMEASHQWTPDGGLPLAGLYVGEVILTVTAN